MNVTPVPWYEPAVLFGPLGLSAFVFWLFGIFFLLLWWRDREPGRHLLGMSALVAGTFYALDQAGLVDVVGRYQRLLPALLHDVGFSLWSLGLAIYLDPVHWRRRWSTWLAVGPLVILGLLNLAQVPVLRVVAGLVIAFSYGVMVPAVWRARRVEPGAGHEWVAVALSVIPILSMLTVAFGVDVKYLRYFGIPGAVLSFMTLLVISVYRRRRELEREVERRRNAEQSLAVANARLTDANVLLEEKVRERTASLHEMVAGLESFNRSISHDLRGPLGGIAGMSQLVAKAVSAGDAPKALRQLGLIEKQASQSHELVTALLTLAQAGDAQLSRTRIETESLVKSIVEELRSRQQAIGTEIEVQSMPDVDADPALLRAVYTNLISNACKFLQGRPEPKVIVGASSEKGESVYFVCDNGPGFDDAAAATLFRPFQRLHGDRYAGHGIGLSIARRAVERHGGRIWAKGAVDQGACFFFTMSPATTA